MEGDGNDEAISATVRVDKKAPRGFGALIAVLEAVYTDYKVRLEFAAQSPFLINPPIGIRRHPKQGRRPSFACGCVGQTIRFAPR